MKEIHASTKRPMLIKNASDLIPNKCNELRRQVLTKHESRNLTVK
jgi:hypothetical protein